MLIKAVRTKELSSYSRGNLVLANAGNAVHSFYVFQLPPGPIWALHTFYVVTSGLMLFWHLRYVRHSSRQDGSQPFTGGSHDDRARRDSDHRSRTGRPRDGLSPTATWTTLRDLGREPKSRRQLESALGLIAALHPGTLRRASEPALPSLEVVIPNQGGGGRLPRGVR